MHPEFKSFADLFNYLYYGHNIPPDKPPMHKILPQYLLKQSAALLVMLLLSLVVTLV